MHTWLALVLISISVYIPADLFVLAIQPNHLREIGLNIYTKMSQIGGIYMIQVYCNMRWTSLSNLYCHLHGKSIAGMDHRFVSLEIVFINWSCCFENYVLVLYFWNYPELCRWYLHTWYFHRSCHFEQFWHLFNTEFDTEEMQFCQSGTLKMRNKKQHQVHTAICQLWYPLHFTAQWI